jgi:N-acetylneuraminate synthase
MTTFIAEIGSNHNQDLDRCLSLIDGAASAGCDAVKLQVYRVDDLFTSDVLAAKPELQARRAWEFPVEFLAPVAERCKEAGIQLGAAAFGLWAVEALEPWVDFLKVASYEVLWLDLVRACAETGKPFVISTGMATLPEIEAAVETARDAGCSDLTLLHCVSGYPTPPEQSNLAAIETLRIACRCPAGWSDHTNDAGVVLRAVQRWDAAAVELHIDLNGTGHEAGGHCWTPARIEEVIGAARMPAPVDSDDSPVDGDGRKVPMPVELPDVAWRADPSDGLRPLRETREALAQQ